MRNGHKAQSVNVQCRISVRVSEQSKHLARMRLAVVTWVIFVLFPPAPHGMLRLGREVALVGVVPCAAIPAPVSARSKAYFAAITFVIGVNDAVTGVAIEAAHFSSLGVWYPRVCSPHFWQYIAMTHPVRNAAFCSSGKNHLWRQNRRLIQFFTIFPPRENHYLGNSTLPFLHNLL
jgi:hypothetical protein